jgi:hypothetical protein
MTTITVTQEDIDNGTPGNSCACPVALAVLRAFNVSEGYVDVGQLYITFRPVYLSHHEYYATSSAVANFITMFDTGAPVEPFEFELGEPVQEVDRIFV